MMGRTPLIVIGIAASLAIGRFSQAASQGTAQPADSLNPMRAIERSALKGFVERPLFDPTRRPPPSAAPAVVAAPPVVEAPAPPPALQLLGVIHGKRDMAIVRRDGNQKTIMLRTGDHIDGWTATVLPPVGLRLDSEGRTSRYAMFAKPGLSVAPTAPDPAADDAGANDPYARPLDKQ